MPISRKHLITSLVLLIVSQVIFLINIQYPIGTNFDEFHYVPSAKQFLELRENQNWEHPPLGKLIMAVGIGIFGDQPLGWRYMSTVFGSLTLIGMYFFGLLLFKTEEIGVWVALLSLANHLLFVQARIGMLDTFMFGFLIWGIAAFCLTWEDMDLQLKRRVFTFVGMMFGLSIACKWFAIIPWLSCVGLVALIRLLQYWQTTFSPMHKNDWYRPDLWKGIRWPEWILYLGIVPFCFYAITFIPYLFTDGDYTIGDFFEMQFKMLSGQLRVVTNHPYMSYWYEWPLLTRPMWYQFDHEGQYNESVRGVFLLGNPLIMWGGLLALLGCLFHWFRERDRAAFFILFFYAVFLGAWIVIPRKIFFYYYYYPAGMMLSPALAYAFNTDQPAEQKKFLYSRWFFLGSAFCLFFYFYPILAALKLPTEGFRKWMWFARWI